MIPRPIIYMALVAAILAGLVAYRTHVFTAGVMQERTRRDAIDVRNNAAAEAARAALNARIKTARDALAEAIVARDKLKEALDHEQAISTARQADLLAGRARERVLVRATSQADPNGPAQCSGPAGVDSGTSIEADIDPRVAGWLEGVRGTYNAAIERLDACIKSYDAVKAAADAMP